MAKTEAESVEAIVDAKSRDVINEKLIAVHVCPDKNQINVPVSAAVINTPKVDNTIPGFHIGLISCILVPIPPVKRMTQSAIIPINWARTIFENWNPTPSTPKNIPTKRNRSNVGIPNLLLALLTTILTNSNTEPINNIFSAVKYIFYFFYKDN